MAKQSTDEQNSGDPVNATGGSGKSPKTNGEGTTFLKEQDDNNDHRGDFPLHQVRRDGG